MKIVADTSQPPTDGRRIRGDATRRAVLGAAVEIASVEGLDGLSFGRLAQELGMSKSGLLAHFRTKEELQLGTLRAGRRIFYDVVIAPVEDVEPGLRRLDALTASSLAYFRGGTYRGGCVISRAATEFANRPGAVRDAVAGARDEWLKFLTDEAGQARDLGELSSRVIPGQLAWELDALGMALELSYQLYGEESALANSTTAARDRLLAVATAKGKRLLQTRAGEPMTLVA